ncbi:cytochrome c [Mangrovimonas sp. DI 80]|uniref:c-type cytochrome n=1 Tax=Mangrovimonas sp. DI 80 TaxID=1779330 RepID=UPI0009780211|nr:cytochrome c [Mangrovimonas sp. DI 80]OMP32349.1 hypothetical protein BKM32_04670 [Mangrovimonas sp. DI 80]
MIKKITRHIFCVVASVTVILIAIASLLFCLTPKEEIGKTAASDIASPQLEDYCLGRDVFKRHCITCHGISSISDPDLLQNLDKKMEQDYFFKFITKQDSLIAYKDRYATEMGSYTEFQNIAISHTFDTITKYSTNKLYEYIVAAKSGKLGL